MASSLSSGRPFLTNDLYALFFFNMNFLIDCVIQGACRGPTVIVLLGMKFEKMLKRVSVSRFQPACLDKSDFQNFHASETLKYFFE